MFQKLRPPKDATIPFLVLISFLAWFIISRTWVYLLPGVYITIRGHHIHHYAYGIIMLSVLSFIFLAYNPPHRWRLRLSIFLGIALAAAYDEFAFWLYFTNTYRDRRSLDAVLIVALVLANATYFPGFWARWGRRLGRLLNILLLGLPRFVYRKLTRSS